MNLHFEDTIIRLSRLKKKLFPLILRNVVERISNTGSIDEQATEILNNKVIEVISRYDVKQDDNV